FLGPGDFNNIDELGKLRLPLDEDNVIITLHTYAPILFTHQGADWTFPNTKTTGIVYPGPPSEPVRPHPSVEGVDWIANWFIAYNNEPRDRNPCSRAALEGEFDRAGAWASFFGRPVHVGEFGVYRLADLESRVNYYRDVREVLDRHGIGWAAWDWSGGFAYWNPVSSEPVEGMRAALFGENVGMAELEFDETLSYGAQEIGTSVSQSITLLNTGTAPLLITEIVSPEGYVIDSELPDIAPGEAGTLVVTFTPGRVEAFTGTIVLFANTATGMHSIPVEGQGVARPEAILRLSGDLDFGSVVLGETHLRELTMENRGDTDLVVDPIEWPTGFSSPWTAEPLAPGATVAVPVVFQPAEVGLYFSTVMVASNGSGDSEFSLEGEGLSVPEAEIQLPSILDLGSIRAGEEAEVSLRIGNSGEQLLNVTELSLPTGFRSEWVGGPILAGGHIDVSIRFAASKAGPVTGELVVRADPGGVTQSVTVTGEVLPVPVPEVGFAGAGLEFPSLYLGGEEEMVAVL
ncbi:MAG: choice-of-anchor D domain-containing protein, partial [Verrucomicrobiota bacterium]